MREARRKVAWEGRTHGWLGSVPTSNTSVSASAVEMPTQCNQPWACVINSPFSPTARSGPKVRKCYCLGIGEQMNLNR